MLVLTATPAVAQGAAAAGNPLDALPRVPAPVQPRADVQIQPAAQPLPVALAQVITPTRFDIEGVRSIAFPEVAGLFAPLVGKSVQVAAIVEQARQATARYLAAGYAISFVYIPEQAFTDGVVRVVAVEGHVVSVRIDGDVGKSRARLESMAVQIVREKPLTTQTFDRYTALLGRLPGTSVQATVPLPSSTDGGTEMALKVNRTPYMVSLGTDVRQPQSRAVLTASVNDPLLSGSQLSASTLLGSQNEERFRALQYLQVIGDEGFTLKASVADYRGDPDDQSGVSSPLDRVARNLRREVSGSYPLLLSGTASLVVAGGIYSIDNTDTLSNPVNGAYLRDSSKVRVAFVQLAYADATPQRSRSASALLARGSDRFGARNAIESNVPGLSGPGPAKAGFTRLALDASYARQFDNAWGTALSAGGQYSRDTLPSVERISFGGSRFGKAYSPGEAAGDRGWGLGAEVNRSFSIGSTRLRQIQPYMLLERARVSGDSVAPGFNQLASVSAGVRLGDLKHYTVDLALSKPTGDASPQNPMRKARVNLALTWSFGNG